MIAVDSTGTTFKRSKAQGFERHETGGRGQVAGAQRVRMQQIDRC